MGVLEYTFWLGLMLPPPETIIAPWLCLVAFVCLCWLWWAKLPSL